VKRKLLLSAILHLLLGLLLIILLLSGVALAATTEETAINKALRWLRTQQQANGSIPTAVSGTYNGTSQAVLAIATANQDPNAWLSSGNTSPLDFLANQAVTQTDTITETGNTAWLTLAVVSAGKNPYSFGGVNLVDTLQSYYDASTGQYGLVGDVPVQALSMMALSVAVTDSQYITQTVPVTATNLLRSWQDASGGWGHAYPCTGYCSPDVDNTALVIQALIAAGEPFSSTSIVKALDFLKTQQGDDGGFQLWGTSNANSTAWGIQALIAAGQDPDGTAWARHGNTPVSFLSSLQTGAGYFEYSDPPPGWSSDLVLTTVQAVPALANKPFPLPGRYTSVKKGLRWLQTQQETNGSIPNSVSGDYNGTNQAVLAITAAGENPLAWNSNGGNDPIDFLKSQVVTQTDTITETGTTARTLLSAVAAGENPENFGGVNLVDTLQSYYDASTGQYGLAGDVPVQALSMIAIRAAGQTVPVAATNLLKSWQDAGGGWGYAYPCTGYCSPDVDNTALVIQALIAAGESVSSTSIVNALAFLKTQQGDDGGFQSWGTSNANSTAWGIQALIAALENPQGADWSQDSKTPWYYLMQLQDDIGSFQYSSPPPDWSADLVLTTVQAVPALAGKPFPYLNEMWIGTAQVETNLLNGDFYATALYAQDLNGNSTAQVRYRSVGGTWSGWQDMTRVETQADAAFARTSSGLDSGSYEFEFQFGDSDGTAQGAISQTVEAAWLKYYLPIIFRNWSP
jgi:hypothetical protein